jgi:soluble lytic murein transglycosylase
MKMLCLPVLALCAVLSLPAGAQGADEIIVQARDALRSKDKTRLSAARNAAIAAKHPLTPWVDYWELTNRLNEAQQNELDAFYARHGGSYVEDRLRNDWLLELGKRRDWANFGRDFPAFRMNDDREVSCYALLTQHLAGQDVRSAARSAWFAQRDGEDGCPLLGKTLFDAKLLTPADAWQAARQAAEFSRPRAARLAATLPFPLAALTVPELFDNPVRYLLRRPPTAESGGHELTLLALMRMAANDPDAAASQLETVWQTQLSPEQAATAWAHIGKQAGMKLLPNAAEYSRRAWRLAAKLKTPPAWSDDLLAWHVRAALRLPAVDGARWSLIQNAIDAMSAPEQQDSPWVYWKARALQARSVPGPEGEIARTTAQQLMESIASPLNFYGKLATEELGAKVVLPASPAALTAAEREATRSNPGLARALQLIGLGLRSEGVREWNFSLRGMTDRELLAAAQWACEREVWDRCINTSDRTRAEVDIAQRFPTPFREQVLAKAREIGVDPAYMYGLIRQESRFIMDARSIVGASGLMQLMPATARWTAKRIGLDYRNELITDRDVNLRLGASYLKLVLDDFGGSQAMAAAAYNAGPNRPRRWREGNNMETAAWAESIPFTETRDYVKKVLSNATLYAAVLGAPAMTLKSRLGKWVGPRETAAPPPDRELP